MSFVLDSSVALTWCFGGEATAVTNELLARTTREGAHAPSLWPLEVVNVLAIAERRGRITPDEGQRCMALLSSLPVILDLETAERAWTATNALSRQFGLTLYDAAYLELAGRLDVPLATLDNGLRRAAKKNGVALLGE